MRATDLFRQCQPQRVFGNAPTHFSAVVQQNPQTLTEPLTRWLRKCMPRRAHDNDGPMAQGNTPVANTMAQRLIASYRHQDVCVQWRRQVQIQLHSQSMEGATTNSRRTRRPRFEMLFLTARAKLLASIGQHMVKPLGLVTTTCGTKLPRKSMELATHLRTMQHEVAERLPQASIGAPPRISAHQVRPLRVSLVNRALCATLAWQIRVAHYRQDEQCNDMA